MVRVEQPKSENDRLSDIVTVVARKHGYEVYKSGWARTTYEINLQNPRTREIKPIAKIESIATTTGEIYLLAPEGRSFAVELGGEIEKAFPSVKEAVVVEKFA